MRVDWKVTGKKIQYTDIDDWEFKDCNEEEKQIIIQERIREDLSLLGTEIVSIEEENPKNTTEQNNSGDSSFPQIMYFHNLNLIDKECDLFNEEKNTSKRVRCEDVGEMNDEYENNGRLPVLFWIGEKPSREEIEKMLNKLDYIESTDWGR